MRTTPLSSLHKPPASSHCVSGCVLRAAGCTRPSDTTGYTSIVDNLVADISCGGSACVARKTDGTAEAWGSSSFGGDASGVNLPLSFAVSVVCADNYFGSAVAVACVPPAPYSLSGCSRSITKSVECNTQTSSSSFCQNLVSTDVVCRHVVVLI